MIFFLQGTTFLSAKPNCFFLNLLIKGLSRSKQFWQYKTDIIFCSLSLLYPIWQISLVKKKECLKLTDILPELKKLIEKV